MNHSNGIKIIGKMSIKVRVLNLSTQHLDLPLNTMTNEESRSKIRQLNKMLLSMEIRYNVRLTSMLTSIFKALLLKVRVTLWSIHIIDITN